MVRFAMGCQFAHTERLGSGFRRGRRGNAMPLNLARFDHAVRCIRISNWQSGKRKKGKKY